MGSAEEIGVGKLSTMNTLRRMTTTAFSVEIPQLESSDMAVLVLTCFDDEDIIVLDALGNHDLLDELKLKGIGIYTNFNVASMGGTLVSMTRADGKPRWFVGEENWPARLADYAIYSAPLANTGLSVFHMDFILLYVLPISRYSKWKERAENSATMRTRLGLDRILPQVAIRDRAFDDFLYRNQIVLLVTNKFDTIIDVSRFSKELLGRGYVDLCGKSIHEIYPELSDFWPKKRRGKVPRKSSIATLLLKDPGKEVRVELSPSFSDERFLGMTVYLSDAERAKKEASSVVSARAHYTFDLLIGTNPRFLNMKREAERIAASDSNVLIQGEMGTGKESFAHAMHNSSPRKGKPFIVVDCGAYINTMIDSLLFGDVRSMYSDSQKSDTIGKLEQASGGTILLNNVDELPLHTQASLASALRTKTVIRMGSNIPRPFNARVMAATKADLRNCVANGSFRSDLYYLINVAEIRTIALRERLDDLPVLVKSHIHYLNRLTHRNVTGVSSDAVDYMRSYSWPGNIRELQNVVERAMDLECGDKITCNFLPEEIKVNRVLSSTSPSTANSAHFGSREQGRYSSFKESEAGRIKRLMTEYAGNKSKVAAEMGMSRSTLYRKLKEIQDWD